MNIAAAMTLTISSYERGRAVVDLRYLFTIK